jgi:RND family efflux transporter MFP subunit
MRQLCYSVGWLWTLVLLAATSQAQDQSQDLWAKAPVVEVTRAEKAYISASQKFVGTVVPTRTSKVGSAASGRVEEFLVNEGDWVKKGQPLAQLRTATIQAELDNAKATLKVREAELAELEKSTPVEKQIAEAKLAMKDAMCKFLIAKRARAFSARSAVSREDLEQANALAEEAQAALNEARGIVAMLDEPRLRKIQQAKAAVAAAQAEVERLSDQLDRHTIRSPFDGCIVAEHTETGEWVLQGALVAEVAELGTVDVEVQVLEDYVVFLREGMKVSVEVSAWSGEIFQGEVAIIVPRANERARTFPVKIRVQNEPLGKSVKLKAGMFARVDLPISADHVESLLVPRDALVLDGQKRFLFVVDPVASSQTKGKVRAVPVELGLSRGDLIQVRGDLQPGQIVVTRGNERLAPGFPVQMLWKGKQGQ